MKVSNCLSTRIREILYDKDISINQLARMTGQSKGTLYSLLYGRYDGANIKTIFIILQALNIKVLEFFDSDLFEDLNKINLD